MGLPLPGGISRSTVARPTSPPPTINSEEEGHSDRWRLPPLPLQLLLLVWSPVSGFAYSPAAEAEAASPSCKSMPPPPPPPAALQLLPNRPAVIPNNSKLFDIWPSSLLQRPGGRGRGRNVNEFTAIWGKGNFLEELNLEGNWPAAAAAAAAESPDGNKRCCCCC